MTKAQNAATREQAENFHVLPKRDAAKEQGRKPSNSEVGTGNIIDRDADAGSLTGAGNSEVNQPLRDSERDRSQVS